MPTAQAGGTSDYGGITEYKNNWQARAITDGINDRKYYPYIGGKIVIITLAGQNLDDGESWKYEIKDETSGSLLFNYTLTYDKASDCVLTQYGAPVTCGYYVPPDANYYRRNTIALRVSAYCINDRHKYSLSVYQDGSLMRGVEGFRPTQFEPYITYVAKKGELAPRAKGQTGGPQTDIGVLVVDKPHPDIGISCGYLLKDVDVKLEATIENGSGGHTHFTNPAEEPAGRFNRVSTGDELGEALTWWVDGGWSNILGGIVYEKYTTVDRVKGKTGMDGIFKANYSSGLFGVRETFKITATRPAGTSPKEPESSYVYQTTLTTKVSGLVEMPESETVFNNKTGSYTASYQFVISSDNCVHSPTAHWAVPSLIWKVYWVAEVYTNVTGYGLSLNDASLPYGGLLDNRDNRGRDTRCHSTHREGRDIDVNSHDLAGRYLPTATFVAENGRKRNLLSYLTEIMKAFGMRREDEAPIHYNDD